MKKRTPVFILAVILGLFPAASSFASAQTGSADGVVSSPAQQSPEEVQKYWTPERMRDAQPMPMPSPPYVVAPRPAPAPMPAPAIPPGVVCPMDAMSCPDGSYVSRGGPNCEFAPCPGGGSGGSAPSGTGTTGPGTIVSPDRPSPGFPDYPLGSPPAGPQTVTFVFEHRTALNEKHVTVRGTIADTLLADKACPPDRGMCAQPRITLKDPETGARYTLEVLLPEDDKTPYIKGQIVEIAGTVSAGPAAVVMRKD